MERVSSNPTPIHLRITTADHIRRLKEQICEAERAGRPASLARQLLEILERP
jgi:hypothetical protein